MSITARSQGLVGDYLSSHGTGLEHCMHCVFMCALLYNMMCVACCVHLCVIVCYKLHKDNIYMVDCVWNTRVEKYNLRGSKR